jgi:hypothetical protein
LRTAFSRNRDRRLDFTCALFDEKGRMIAQPTQGLPSFIGALATAVSHFLRAFPPASLAPGDSLVTNDPWIGTSQLNDMVFVSPIFHRRRIVGYAATSRTRRTSGDACSLPTRASCSRKACACPSASSSRGAVPIRRCSTSSAPTCGSPTSWWRPPRPGGGQHHD